MFSKIDQLTRNCTILMASISVAACSNPNALPTIEAVQGSRPPATMRIAGRTFVVNARHGLSKAPISVVEDPDNSIRFPLSKLTQPNKGGQIGIIYNQQIPSGSRFYSGSVFHEYVAPNFALIAPSAGVQSSLYAPTTHFEGQCFEVGSNYTQSSLASLVTLVLFVYDFCATPNGFTNYSVPSDIQITEGYPDGTNHPSMDFYAYVDGNNLEHVGYVNSSFNMVDFAASNGNALTEPSAKFSAMPSIALSVWNMFETHYNALGNCPYVPTIYSEQFSYTWYNSSTYQTGTSAEYSPGSVEPNSNINPSQCTSNDQSLQGFYYTGSLLGSPTFGGWSVSSSYST